MNGTILKAEAIHWKAGVMFVLAAATCFHLAYLLALRPWGGPLMAGYLVLLVQIARLKTTRQSFYFGLTLGLLCAAPQAGFLWNIFGGAAIPLWLILSLWIAAFTGLTHLVLVRFQSPWWLAAIPFLWAGLEYFRSELYYLKFSWLNVGYVAANLPPFPTHLVGMYGAGFLLAAVATVFLIQPRVKWLAAIGCLAGLCLILSARSENEQKSTVRIAGIQLEMPFERDLPGMLDDLRTRHPDADLFVLSEYTLDGPVPESLLAWCKQNQRHLVVGGKDPATNGSFYNTAFVVGPDGTIVFRQAKSVPIQFFKDGLPAPARRVWNSPWGRIGICICYDLSYTRVTDELVRSGAQLLIVPSMDLVEWGKRQHELHALVAPVRAREYRVPIFRLASSGISQAVDASGTVLSTASFAGAGETLFVAMPLVPHGTLPIDRVLAPAATTLTVAMGLALIWRRLASNRTAVKAVPIPKAQPQPSFASTHV
jgi:apolipoprotein N-acyltransferase